MGVQLENKVNECTRRLVLQVLYTATVILDRRHCSVVGNWGTISVGGQ